MLQSVKMCVEKKGSLLRVSAVFWFSRTKMLSILCLTHPTLFVFSQYWGASPFNHLMINCCNDFLLLFFVAVVIFISFHFAYLNTRPTEHECESLWPNNGRKHSMKLKILRVAHQLPAMPILFSIRWETKQHEIAMTLLHCVYRASFEWMNNIVNICRRE